MAALVLLLGACGGSGNNEKSGLGGAAGGGATAGAAGAGLAGQGGGGRGGNTAGSGGNGATGGAVGRDGGVDRGGGESGGAAAGNRGHGGEGGGGAAGGTAGGGATGGGASGGVAGAGGTIYTCPPGSVDAGAATSVYGTSGQACDPLGALACAGPNQQQTLICQGGTWRAFTICPATQRCDPTSGVCADIVAACVGQSPGYVACDQNTLVTCGPDLLTVVQTPCCGVCAGGTCVAPRCGDGKVEAPEACDDGNLAPGDGCDPNCQPTKVLQLAAGRAHTCALLSGGYVRCWGANEQGQLGLGDTTDRTAQQPYQNGLVSLGGPAAFIATGADHTCALMADGSLRCWGANSHGQLGLGNTDALGDNEAPSSSGPIALGLTVTAVSAGGDDTCAILADRTVRCWGNNNYGQLGLGNTADVGDNELPTQAASQVTLGGDAVLVTTGGNFACAILAGRLTGRCWGQNGLGQLGLGVTQNIGDDELPTAIAPFVFPTNTVDPTFFEVTSISSGSTRTIAFMAKAGENFCWGDNSDGGLGIEEVGDDPYTKATGWGAFDWPAPALSAVAGGLHMCINLANNDLRCWGINQKGQLGLPNTDTLGDNEAADGVAAIDLGIGADGFASYAVSMTAGAAHTCAILGDGRVLCWGANESGQLGLGYVSSPPVDYVGGTPATIPAMLPTLKVLGP